jgi:hypothetical protein
MALHDSPVGVASWLVEKYRMWSDCGGIAKNVWRFLMRDGVVVYHGPRTEVAEFMER